MNFYPSGNRSGLKYVTCKEDLVWDPSSMKDEEDGKNLKNII